MFSLGTNPSFGGAFGGCVHAKGSCVHVAIDRSLKSLVLDDSTRWGLIGVTKASLVAFLVAGDNMNGDVMD